MNKTRLQKIIAHELPFFMAVPAVVWQALFFVIPIACIIFLSFIGKDSASWHSFFTLEHYRSLADAIHVHTIFRSAVLALATASACLVCAYPVAYFLAVKVRRFKNFLLFLLVVPLWTNLIVLAYAWFVVLERHGLINTVLMKLGIISSPLQLLNSMFGIFVVMVYCYLPFMVMPLYSTLEKLDMRLLEASADLGATPRETFFRITLPLSLSGIRTGFFLVFIPSFGEFVIPSLMGGDRKLMVGSLISHYFLVIRDGSVGAAFTVVSAFVLLAMIVVIHAVLGMMLGGSGRSKL